MKCLLLKLLLLATFAFWASGLAKYTHEALEHHGRDASVDDDDDDSEAAQSADYKPAASPTEPVSPQPAKKPCPVCQMMAAMTVVHSPPPVFPVRSEVAIGTVPTVGRHHITLHACFELSARDPPPMTAQV